MRKMLHIDTAGENGMVCLSAQGELIDVIKSTDQKEHASFIHEAIKTLLERNAIDFNELEAVVVTEGPGSYTGLRVGLSSAKGLCFALDVPLITLNALEILAHASAQLHPGDFLYWPMIDARRDEVFTATYDTNLSVVLPPQALILNADVIKKEINTEKIIFSGSGSRKILNYISTEHNIISDIDTNLSHCRMGFNKLEKKIFADLLYSEPLYIKEFYEKKI